MATIQEIRYSSGEIVYRVYWRRKRKLLKSVEYVNRVDAERFAEWINSH